MRRLLTILAAWSLACPLAWGAMFFNVDDGVDLVAASNYGTSAGPLTICTWVYVVDYTPDVRGSLFRTNFGDGTGFVVFDALNDSASGFTNCVLFQRDGTTDLIVRTNDETLSQDALHHVCVTWDGGSTATNTDIYIDGVEVSYQTQQNMVTETADDGTPIYRLGIGSAGHDTRELNGYLSDAAMWSVELTAAEVALLYNSRIKGMPLQIQPASLVAYYPLHEVGQDASGDAVTFKNATGNAALDGMGNNGADNINLTGQAEPVLSYP